MCLCCCCLPCCHRHIARRGTILQQLLLWQLGEPSVFLVEVGVALLSPNADTQANYSVRRVFLPVVRDKHFSEAAGRNHWQGRYLRETPQKSVQKVQTTKMK